MTEEQAFALADPHGPNLPAAFVMALGTLRAEPRITEAFRTGAGVGWHEQHPDVFAGTDAFFRAGYAANLVPSWLPALDGVEAKLQAGGRVADVGCGLGASSVLLAQAYPDSTVVGSDFHDAVDRPGPQACRRRRSGRPRVVRGGVGADLHRHRLRPGDDLRLPARHGRPGGRRPAHPRSPHPGRHLAHRRAATPRDTVADNLNPVGRMYYSVSTFLCVPNGLSQPGGYALGAQAGEAAIRQVTTDAGFTRFRRAAETPFNLVYEVRP